MVGTFSTTTTPSVETGAGYVDVTTTSAIILASNTKRKYALLVNDSDTIIYLGIGATAVVNRGIRLNSSGGSYEITSINLTKKAIYGIHGGAGNKRLTIIEG